MKPLYPLIIVAIVVLGAGPWLIIPVLTGQALKGMPAVKLGLAQLFLFAPLSICLMANGLSSLFRKLKDKAHDNCNNGTNPN